MPSIFTNAVAPASSGHDISQPPATAKMEDDVNQLPDPPGKAALLDTELSPSGSNSSPNTAGTPGDNAILPSPPPSNANTGETSPSPPVITIDGNKEEGKRMEEGVAQRGSAVPSTQPTEPQYVRVQLIPFAEPPNRIAAGLEMVERKLKDGVVLKIGRLVVKDGQTQPPKGKSSDLDIWYTSKVVSRTHAEVWAKDGQIYIKDIGSSSGTFLNKMRLSPSGKESRPYPVKENDVIQFGVDYKGKTEDIFKCITVKVGFYDQSWVKQSRKNANPVRFRNALKALLAACNPYGSSTSAPAARDVDEDDPTATECCICIGSVAPFQAIFIAPCSHCFHFKCVSSLIAQSAMFQCPLCRQVANLAASVSTDSLNEEEEDAGVVERSPNVMEGEEMGISDGERESDREGGHDRQRTEVVRPEGGSGEGEENGDGLYTAKPSVVRRNIDEVSSPSSSRARERASWHGDGQASGTKSPIPPLPTSEDSAPGTPSDRLQVSSSQHRHSVGSHDRQKSAGSSAAFQWNKKGKGKAEEADISEDSMGSPSAVKPPGTHRKASISAKFGDMFKKKGGGKGTGNGDGGEH